jgi:hypothetical protein
VNNKASRLIEARGNDAWPTIYRESRDLDQPEEERLIHLAVNLPSIKASRPSSGSVSAYPAQGSTQR